MTCKRNMNGFTFFMRNCDYYVTAPYVNVTEGLARKISRATGRNVNKNQIQRCTKESKKYGICLVTENGCVVIPFADMQGKYKELEVNI